MKDASRLLPTCLRASRLWSPGLVVMVLMLATTFGFAQQASPPRLKVLVERTGDEVMWPDAKGHRVPAKIREAAEGLITLHISNDLRSGVRLRMSSGDVVGPSVDAIISSRVHDLYAEFPEGYLVAVLPAGKYTIECTAEGLDGSITTASTTLKGESKVGYDVTISALPESAAASDQPAAAPLHP